MKKVIEEEAARIAVGGVMDFFRQNPHRPVAYIQTGLERRVLVLGTHLGQLVQLAGIGLECEGRTVCHFPPTFIDPKAYSNIGAVLRVVRTKYPPPANVRP